MKALLFLLADRVYWWSLEQVQDTDTILLAKAREHGWMPWHERNARERL